ncbi:hypothetical protein HPB49_019032 [Dermacentor silvarum]|uniref:Uncharacterized protein n=1 Tax=Dermacentor silvarum TaxID=543639 RepID=A0ACB8CGY1_DERSI|nr:hypothetical protein HPB49_019032 [Dermacentor silvarum]
MTTWVKPGDVSSDSGDEFTVPSTSALAPIESSENDENIEPPPKKRPKKAYARKRKPKKARAKPIDHDSDHEEEEDDSLSAGWIAEQPCDIPVSIAENPPTYSQKLNVDCSACDAFSLYFDEELRVATTVTEDMERQLGHPENDATSGRMNQASHGEPGPSGGDSWTMRPGGRHTSEECLRVLGRRLRSAVRETIVRELKRVQKLFVRKILNDVDFRNFGEMIITGLLVTWLALRSLAEHPSNWLVRDSMLQQALHKMAANVPEDYVIPQYLTYGQIELGDMKIKPWYDDFSVFGPIQRYNVDEKTMIDSRSRERSEQRTKKAPGRWFESTEEDDFYRRRSRSRSPQGGTVKSSTPSRDPSSSRASQRSNSPLPKKQQEVGAKPAKMQGYYTLSDSLNSKVATLKTPEGTGGFRYRPDQHAGID